MARSSTEADKRRATAPGRVDVDVIAALPALLTTDEAARIVGQTPLYVSKMCARGEYPGQKCGRQWRINKAKFLQRVGLA